ncbi:TetR/AcrR family transcriptional regulator [Sneathiella glossodoripedis]|uniref:TetR/AcrR family transcriptional regulator n=1 Tax=Sneathiella glossodoripedis TaxID=418853 RepID=UPI00131F1A8C|nr:TetR/AcrR family transcriptional regulator [Sneathiella glossodoripedis]
MSSTHEGQISSPASDGIKPAHQSRSKQRRDELINAGMELMCHKNFADISIIELTASCGYSVGTFYSRFHDKDSFFKAVQSEAISRCHAELRKSYSGEFWKTMSNEDFFRKMVDVLIDGLSGPFRGVVKASIIMSASSREAWEPIRQSGLVIRNLIIDLVKDRFLKDDPNKSIRSIEFALQMFFGTIVQAILNNPGPVHLEDEEMRENLTRMLVRYTELEER